MTRAARIALVLLAAGCSGQPPQEEPATVAAEAAPAPPAEADPLLTAEKVPDLTVQPVPAGTRVSPHSYPASYRPLHHGPTPAPTPIPVLPTRKPAHVLGDRRFLAPGSASGGVALSPDGKRMALGTCLFDAATGELDAAYDAGGNAVHKLVFSPDGTRLYCGEGPLGNIPTHGNVLAVRDVPGKQQLLTIRTTDWGLSGDGRLLATIEQVGFDPHEGKPGPRNLLAHYYLAVRLYDTTTWKGVAAYRARGARPTAVALSPDGGRIVVGCDDGAVRVWDRAAGREVATFRDLCEAPSPSRKPVVDMFAFSPDGKTLAAANARPHDSDTPRQVAWWRWPDGTLLRLKPAPKYYDPTDLRFSPDGRHLFAGHSSRASVWDAASGELRTELTYEADKRAVPSVSFPAADRVFAPDRTRPTLLVFPSLDPVPWPERPFAPRPPAPDFKTVEPMPPEKPMPYPHPGYELPGGGRVRVLRPVDEREAGFEHTDAAGKRVRHYEAGRTGSYAVSPDGKLLVTSASASGITYGAYDYAKWENPVRFWELATGRELGVIRVYPKAEGRFAFSPDGARLAMLHADGLIRLWDVATRTPTLALDPAGHGFDRLTFSTDGRRLVGGGFESPVMIVWDAVAPAR